VRTAVPAGGDIVAALGTQHALAAKPKLPDLSRVLILRHLVGGNDARVILDERQHHCGLEVAWLNAVRPRDPRGSKQRIGGGQQRGLVNAHILRARGAGQRDRPHPAAIAGQQALEVVCDGVLILLDCTKVRANGRGVLGKLNGSRLGDLDGFREHRVDHHASSCSATARSTAATLRPLSASG